MALAMGEYGIYLGDPLRQSPGNSWSSVAGKAWDSTGKLHPGRDPKQIP